MCIGPFIGKQTNIGKNTDYLIIFIELRNRKKIEDLLVNDKEIPLYDSIGEFMRADTIEKEMVYIEKFIIFALNICHFNEINII